MATTFHPFIEFDDLRSAEEKSLPPFSRPEPEALDLSEFIPLTHAKDYAFYSAVAGVRSGEGPEPLFKPRGLPPCCSSLVARKLDDFFDPDDPTIGWLYLDEIEQAMSAAGVKQADLSPELVMLLDCLRSFERSLGTRRARLVFAFS